MKPVIQLLAASLLAFSTLGITMLTGCAAPTPQTLGGDETTDPTASDSDQTGKLPAKKPTNTGSNKAPTTTTPPATTPPATTPPATTPPATTPPATTPPAGTPQACMDQCAAKTPAATYWTCSASCKDQACDDNCWNPTCGQNAQACGSALDACAVQCGLPPAGP